MSFLKEAVCVRVSYKLHTKFLVPFRVPSRRPLYYMGYLEFESASLADGSLTMSAKRAIRRYGITFPIILALGITVILYYWVEHIDHRLKLLAGVIRHAHALQQEQEIAAVQFAKYSSRARKQLERYKHGSQSPLLSEEDSTLKNESTGSFSNGSPLWHSDSSNSESYDCRHFPGASDILLVIKTGATELYRRIPVHLLTTTTCVQDFVIFSDMEQELGDIHIYDALESISEEWKEKDHHISHIYDKQKYAHSQGRDVDMAITEGAWEVDKWKNVPMAIKAYEMYPDKKWFMFMDADSTLLWSNLVLWTSKLNASNPQYYGSVTNIGETRFAHGGTGYLLSAPALKAMVDIAPKKMAEWEERTSHVCCGDAMIAEALATGGTEVTHKYPLFNGGTPRSTDYDDGHWCKPPLTFHHVSPREIEELWRWEQQMLMEKVCCNALQKMCQYTSDTWTGQKHPDTLRRSLLSICRPLSALRT